MVYMPWKNTLILYAQCAERTQWTETVMGLSSGSETAVKWMNYAERHTKTHNEQAAAARVRRVRPPPDEQTVALVSA